MTCKTVDKFKEKYKNNVSIFNEIIPSTCNIAPYKNTIDILQIDILQIDIL